MAKSKYNRNKTKGAVVAERSNSYNSYIDWTVHDFDLCIASSRHDDDSFSRDRFIFGLITERLRSRREASLLLTNSLYIDR